MAKPVKPNLTNIRNPQRLRERRRGAAVVEFAIVAPLFFLLVLGIIEFGRMVMVQQIITNAAREGARTGIVSGATYSGVTSTVNGYLAATGISGASVSVNPDPGSASYGSQITVTVTIPFSQVSWTPTPFFLGSKSLTANCVMRSENN